MPYADVLDVTTPATTEGVSQGDDRIREIKRAVNQRMTDLVNGWPNGPLTLKGDVMEDGSIDEDKLGSALLANLARYEATVIATGTVTVNAGDILDLAPQALPGARPGDVCLIGPPDTIEAAVKMLQVSARVDANDEVTFRLTNLTGSNITFTTSHQYTIAVVKPYSSWP